MTTATEAGYVEMRIAKAVGLAPTEHELLHYLVLEEVAGDRHLAIEIGWAEAVSLAAVPTRSRPLRPRSEGITRSAVRTRQYLTDRS